MIDEKNSLAIFNNIHKEYLTTISQTDDNSVAYGIGFNKETETYDDPVFIDKSSDVYSLINKIKLSEHPVLWDGIVIFTTGWAAPVDSSEIENEVAPSKHPKRVRVIVMSIVTPDTEIASVLKLQNEDEPMYDTSGYGELAKSIKSIYKKGKTFNAGNNQFLI